MSQTENDLGEDVGIGLAHRPPASNVLLLGPSLHGSSRCVGHDSDVTRSSTVLYILFTRSHANQVERWVTTADAIPETVIIDAIPNAGRMDAFDLETVTLESVSSPSNLTEIGVALNRHLPETDDERLVVCVRSLTAMLQYVDLQQAYRFLNTMANQLASVDARAHYHLDPGAHDDKVVTTLSSLFDSVYDLDEPDPLLS